MNNEKYSPVMCVMHWLIALLVIGVIIGGYIYADMDPDTQPFKWTLLGWHKSFGVMILLLVVLRFVARLNSTLPPYPSVITRSVQKMAVLNHWILYGILLVQPVNGIIMSMLAGYDVKVFGIAIPTFIAPNKALAATFNEVHKIIPYLLIVLIVLHILATAKHYFIDKVNLLKRMI